MGTSLVHKGIPNEEQRKEINGPLVKMIKYALEGLIKYQSKDIKGASYRYLINQSIRQYILPTDNIHISEVASVLWGKLFEGCSELPNMLMYTYQDKIQPSNTLSVKTCKGTNKKQIEEDIKAGDKRPYNSIFIDEHTTPVSDVVKALVEKFSQSNSISVFGWCKLNCVK